MSSRVLLVALALVACGGRDADRSEPRSTGQGPSPSAAPEKPAPQPAPRPVTAKLDRPELNLLEPGSEPRRSLRYDPVLGTQTIALTLASTIALDLGVAAIPPTQAPALQIRFRSQTRRRDDGAFALVLSASEVEALAGEGSSSTLAAGMQPTLDALEKLRAELVLEADGALVETTLSLPPTKDANGPTDAERLQNAFAQLFVALPAEPIGVGGRWSVTQSLPLAGARIAQTSTFTLESLDGDRLVVALDLAQAPAPTGKRDDPPAHDGTTLDSLRTTGTGTIELDLRHFGPHEAHTHSHSEATQTIERDGQRQQVAFSLDVDLDAKLAAPGGDVSPDAP